MHRTDADGNVAGAFTDGSVIEPVQEATVIGSKWLNAVQEELALTVEGLGGTLSAASNNQLLTRLNAKYGRLDLVNSWAAAQTFAGGVSGNTTFSANVSVGGTLGVTGNTSLGGSLAVTASTTLTGPATLNGTTAINAGLTVDTNVLVVDATNNRVGVNTSTMNCSLAVGHQGVADAVVPVQINAPNASYAYFSANKGGSLGLAMGYVNNVAGDSRGAIRSVPNDPISVYVNNSTEVVEFNATGLTVKTAAPASTMAVKDTLTKANIPKVLATVTSDGAGGATVNSGFNVASASASGVVLRITFAQALTSTNYTVIATGTTIRDLLTVSTRATTYCGPAAFDIQAAGGSRPFNTTAITAMVCVFGPQ